jgi:hypothetical protein
MLVDIRLFRCRSQPGCCPAGVHERSVRRAGGYVLCKVCSGSPTSRTSSDVMAYRTESSGAPKWSKISLAHALAVESSDPG